jgi:hypothetical protein
MILLPDHTHQPKKISQLSHSFQNDSAAVVSKKKSRRGQSYVSSVSNPTMGTSTKISDISPSMNTDQSAPSSGISRTFSAAFTKLSDTATASRKALETSFVGGVVDTGSPTYNSGASVALSTIAVRSGAPTTIVTADDDSYKLTKWLTSTRVGVRTSATPSGGRAVDSWYNDPLSTRATLGRIRPKTYVKDLPSPSTVLGPWAGCTAFPALLGSSPTNMESKRKLNHQQLPGATKKYLGDMQDEESTVPSLQPKSVKQNSPSKSRLRAQTYASTHSSQRHRGPRKSLQLAKFEDDDEYSTPLSESSSTPANRSNHSRNNRNPPKRKLLPILDMKVSGDLEKRGHVGELYNYPTNRSSSDDVDERRPQQSDKSNKYDFNVATPKWVSWDTDNVVGLVRVTQVPKNPQTLATTEDSVPYAINSFEVEATLPDENGLLGSRGESTGGTFGVVDPITHKVDPPDGRLAEKRLRYRRAKHALNALLKKTDDSIDLKEGLTTKVADDHALPDPSPRSRKVPGKSPKGSRQEMMKGSKGRGSRSFRGPGAVSTSTGADWDSLRPAQLYQIPPGSYKRSPRLSQSPKTAPFRRVQVGPGAPVSPLGRSHRSPKNLGAAPRRTRPDSPGASPY